MSFELISYHIRCIVFTDPSCWDLISALYTMLFPNTFHSAGIHLHFDSYIDRKPVGSLYLIIVCGCGWRWSICSVILISNFNSDIRFCVGGFFY